MLQCHAQKEAGYTLLEMTLVLAIIAVIATFALKLYRDTTESNRANKVALEMQHVMEAAIAYNNNKNYWPTDNSYTTDPPAATDCATPKDLTFVNNYLPNQSNLSSYGVSICWSGANDGTQTPPPNYQRFWVAVALPGTYIATAQHVAALLPNAIATADQPKPLVATVKSSPFAPHSATASSDSDKVFAAPTPCTVTTKPCYVRAEIPLPATQQSTSTPGFYAAGYCVPNNQDTPGSQLVSNTSISNCSSGVCYTTPQYSSSADVYCQQLAKPSLDAAGATGTGTDEDYRRQYRITFACGGGLHEKLYITPNFFQMAIFNKQTDYDNGEVAQAVYSILPTLNSSQYDCTNGICNVVMQAYYGGDLWLKPSSQPKKILVTHRGAGLGDSLPEEPGTIGATYVAVCVP